MGRYTIFGTQILSQATGEPGSLHLSKICHSFLSGKKVLSCQEGLRSQARSPPPEGMPLPVLSAHSFFWLSWGLSYPLSQDSTPIPYLMPLSYHF